MQFSRGFRAHLRWTLLHPEEVFLQHWVGLYLSPDWIRHTHPPAQGQGHKSECKKDRTQMKGCVSNRRKVRGPEAWASLINMYSSNPSEKRVWKLRTKMPTQAGQNFLPLLPRPTNCEKASALFPPVKSWIKNCVVPGRNTAFTTYKHPPATQEFPSRRPRPRLATGRSSPARPLRPRTAAGTLPAPGNSGRVSPHPSLPTHPTPKWECARSVPRESSAMAPLLPGRPPLLPPPG